MKKMISSLFFLVLLAITGAAQRVEYRHDELLPVEDLLPYFRQASEEFHVPIEILMGVGYVESHWRQRIPDEHDHHMPPSFGVMGLRNDAHFGHSLVKAASLIHQPVSALKSNSLQNIRGAAAYLAFLARIISPANRPQTDLASWEKVLEKYSGIPQADIATIYADEVYDILIKGCRMGHIQIPAASINRHVSAIPERRTGHRALAPDYPSALWVPASTSNYTSSSRTTTYPVNLIVMHDMEGTYASSISWFQNSTAAACAHYLIRSSDGQVTQMVQEKDVAWHCGNWAYNTRSIGIEQEGYYNDPSYYTSTMYTSAAALCQYLCNKYSFPKTREYIIGHDQVPDPNDSTLWGGANQHQDPGGFYKWRTLIEQTSGVASAFTPVKITASTLNVRCEPRATSPIITTVSANQEYVKYGTATDGWALIFITGKNSEHYDGWVSNAYVTADNCAPQIETQNSWPSIIGVYTNAASSTSNVDAVTDGQRFVAIGSAVSGYDGNTSWRNFYTPAGATVTTGWITGADLNYIAGGTVTPALSITAPTTSVCPNQSITFTGTPVNGGSAPAYQWYVGGVASGTASGLTLNNITTGTTVYCVLTSNSSCVTTTTAQSNQIAVTVTNPVSTPVISPAGPSGCDSVPLSAGSAGCTSCTYQWSTPGGTVSGSSLTATTGGVYSVTSTDGGCSASASTIVTITSAVNVSVTAGNNMICSGGTGTTITASGNATAYTWAGGLGSGQSINVSPVATTTYSVTAANGNCSATGSTTIAVTQTPVISVSPAITSICIGGSGTTLSVNGAATSYSWSAGLGSGQTVTVNPTSSTTYSVTAANGNCSATSSAVVNVSNQPTASISPGAVTICPGNTAVLSANPSGINYTWSGPGNYSASAQTANISVTGLYSVTITSPGGCTGSATASIEVGPGISPTVNAGNNVSIQSGQQTQLNVTAGGGVSPYSYIWTPATGLNSDTISNAIASPTVTTTYVVTVTGANGCSGTGVVVVTVQGSVCDTSITPAVVMNGDQLAVSYYANATYQWQLNGHNIPDSTSRYIVAGSQGYYTVVVTIGNCTYPSNDEFFTAISDLNIRQLSIAPNPSNGLFKLSLETTKPENLTFKIFDASGRMIQDDAGAQVNGTYSRNINLCNVGKGIYMLQIIAEGHVFTRRLVID